MWKPDPADRGEGRALLALIALSALIRVGFAWASGLGIDESYMVATGRNLRLGYFDHPPASWWLQWAGAHLFATEAPLAVRLPFIALFALTTWAMFRLGTELAGRRAGLWAAVALNLSPVFGVTTASWVLPDGPLEAALACAALCLLRALPARGAAAWGRWLGAGLASGIALCSKYSAALTIVGALVFLASSGAGRAWLRRPHPYAAGLLALAVFSPVIAWNAAHHWASFAFQGDRAAGLRFRPWQFLLVLGGEALFVLPWLWAPMMAAFAAALRRGPGEWRCWLLTCLAAPPILIFALIAIVSRDRVLFHWAAPGYLMGFPLLGAAIAERSGRRWVRRTLAGTAVLILAALAVIGAQLRTGWLTPVIAAVARHDPDLAGIDWRSIRPELAARGLLGAGTIVAVPGWASGGKIAYALGPGARVICLSPDARQFGLDLPASRAVGRTMLVLAPGRAGAGYLAGHFAAFRALAPVAIRRGGQVLGWVSVGIGTGLRG